MRTKDERTERIFDSLARMILSDMRKEKDAECESAPCERREHEDESHSASHSQSEF